MSMQEGERATLICFEVFASPKAAALLITLQEPCMMRGTGDQPHLQPGFAGQGLGLLLGFGGAAVL